MLFFANYGKKSNLFQKLKNNKSVPSVIKKISLLK